MIQVDTGRQIVKEGNQELLKDIASVLQNNMYKDKPLIKQLNLTQIRISTNEFEDFLTNMEQEAIARGYRSDMAKAILKRITRDTQNYYM